MRNGTKIMIHVHAAVAAAAPAQRSLPRASNELQPRASHNDVTRKLATCRKTCRVPCPYPCTAIRFRKKG
eukprot:136763-Prymnesium_polylepis.1